MKSDTNPHDILAEVLTTPAKDGLELWPVSRLVNDVRNEGLELIEPIAADPLDALEEDAGEDDDGGHDEGPDTDRLAGEASDGGNQASERTQYPDQHEDECDTDGRQLWCVLRATAHSQMPGNSEPITNSMGEPKRQA